MIDFILINIRLTALNIVATKMLYLGLDSLVINRRKQQQQVVRDYQTSCMKHKTFISEMVRCRAPLNKIVEVLVEEQCSLMNEKGEFCFQVEVKQEPQIWGQRFVRAQVYEYPVGQAKADFFQHNLPTILTVPRGIFETYNLVLVDQKGEYTVHNTATNNPEIYQLIEKPKFLGIPGVSKNDIRDFVNYKSSWASITTAQLRDLYKTQYKQKQLSNESEMIKNPENKVKEQPQKLQKVERQRIMAMASPPSEYYSSGRNFHGWSIAIGFGAMFFSVATMYWLHNETKKETNR